LIRQLLAESLALALAGGALGVLLAKWSLIAITHLNALNLPRVSEIRLDGVVLAFSVAVSIVTGVLFGLFPSLRASRPHLADELRESGAAAGRRGTFAMTARGLLVVGQIALSIVLLIGAARHPTQRKHGSPSVARLSERRESGRAAYQGSLR
jgi:hypothetical protein